MARQKLAAALAVLMLLAAGCGAGTGNTPNTAAEEADSGQSVMPDADGQNGANEPSDASPSPAEDQAGSGADGSDGNNTIVDDGDPDPADDAAEPLAPLYRMNAAYRFVPIDPETTSSQVVLLTFDDGPKERDMLQRMLDTLDKHDAKAVFFVNGYRADKQPELLELIRDHGQTIGNHSWDHIDLKKEDEEVVRKQIGDVQSLVEQTIGSSPKLFRPPFGSGGDSVRRIAEEYGLLYMTWSNGSLDWDASTKDNPEAVIQNVMDQLHPGANILMHELPWTEQALDKLLTEIESEGYGFIDPARIETPAAPSH